MEKVERIINYVYLLHLGKNSEKKISEEIKYGAFLDKDFPSSEK